MPLRRYIERFLIACLWITAAVLFGGAILIIVTMDRGSINQGGRFYVAIFALVPLCWVASEINRMLMRHVPFSFGTTTQEQRYALISFGLLFAAAAVLIGLALLLP